MRNRKPIHFKTTILDFDDLRPTGKDCILNDVPEVSENPKERKSIRFEKSQVFKGVNEKKNRLLLNIYFHSVIFETQFFSIFVFYHQQFTITGAPPEYLNT